jgi:hypothetical protein
MEVTVCKYGTRNKANSIGYGFRFLAKDSELYFKSEWKTVLLELPDYSELIKCKIDKDSFRKSQYYNLRNKKIGDWLIIKGLQRWPNRMPPKLNMIQIEDNKFKIL